METKIRRVCVSNNPVQVGNGPSKMLSPKTTVVLEGGMPKPIAKIYRHIFAGGTLDQMDHNDVIILILNTAVKDGTVKRKSFGSLYDRTIAYLDTRTGYIELKTPASWGGVDLTEIKETMDVLEKQKLL